MQARAHSPERTDLARGRAAMEVCGSSAGDGGAGLRAERTLPLGAHAEALAVQIAGRRGALLALDFDGTLTEIVPDPDAPRLPPERRALLERLAAVPGFGVVLLSGRSGADAAARLGVAGVEVIGNHGFEIAGESVPEAVRSRPALSAFLTDLAREETRKGLPCPIRVEDKGATATVHLVGSRADAERERLLEALERRLSARAAEFSRQERDREGGGSDEPLLRLHPGKASVEVRPAAEWDKARALLRLLERTGTPARDALYAGDDVTDECVFEALADGVTIKVGTGPTAAGYRAAEPAELHRFLEILLRHATSGV